MRWWWVLLVFEYVTWMLQKWENDSGPGDQTVLKSLIGFWNHVVLLELGIERGSFLHLFFQLNCDPICMVKPSLSVQSIEEVQIKHMGSITLFSNWGKWVFQHRSWSLHCDWLVLLSASPSGLYPTKWSPATCPHSDIYSTRDFFETLKVWG